MSQVIGTEEHHDMWSWPCRKAETRLGSRLEASLTGYGVLKKGLWSRALSLGLNLRFLFLCLFVCLSTVGTDKGLLTSGRKLEVGRIWSARDCLN